MLIKQAQRVQESQRHCLLIEISKVASVSLEVHAETCHRDAAPVELSGAIGVWLAQGPRIIGTIRMQHQPSKAVHPWGCMVLSQNLGSCAPGALRVQVPPKCICWVSCAVKEDYPQALQLNAICPLDSGFVGDLLPPSFFYVAPVWNGNLSFSVVECCSLNVSLFQIWCDL